MKVKLYKFIFDSLNLFTLSIRCFKKYHTWYCETTESCDHVLYVCGWQRSGGRGSHQCHDVKQFYEFSKASWCASMS